MTSEPRADLDAHWHELLTVALLGVERRDPPSPPAGPVGDVVADAVLDSPAARLLADVATCAAVRRAAFVAGPPVAPLAPPAADPRPLCPPAAVDTWHRLSDHWPVLEDEWVVRVIQGGWRPPPDLTVALLARHRGDPVRRARVVRSAGPVAVWLQDHVPGLAPRTSPRQPVAEAEALTLPPLAIPPELDELLTVDARTFVARLLPRFDDGRVGAPHRPVLVNLLARCRPEVLIDASAALGGVDVDSPSAGLARSLADLAATRARVHVTLPAAPRGGSGVTGDR